MAHEINTAKLAGSISDRRKKDKLGVRAAAEQIGDVSASTLSRVEKGNLPDLDTYLRICRWLGYAPSFFQASPRSETKDESQLPDDLIVQLRADRTLDERTQDALVTMIRTAYAAARAGTITDEAVQE